MRAASSRREARAMLRPKASWLGRHTLRHYLGLCEHGLASLSYLAEKLARPERRALAEIAAKADLLMIGKRTYIVAELSPATLDALAAFDAEREDIEIDNEDSCGAFEDDLQRHTGSVLDATEDDEPNHDNEDDHQGFGNPMLTLTGPTVEAQLRAKMAGAS